MSSLSEQVRELEADVRLAVSNADKWQERYQAAESRLAQARAEGAREALTRLHRSSTHWVSFTSADVLQFRDKHYPAPASGERCRLGCASRDGAACNCDRPTPSPVERVTLQAYNPCAANPAEFINIHITPADARRIVSLAAQDGGTRDA